MWLSGFVVEYENVPICCTEMQLHIHFYIHHSFSLSEYK